MKQSGKRRTARQSVLAESKRLFWQGSARMIMTVTILACCAVFSIQASASCKSSASPGPVLALPEGHFVQTMGVPQAPQRSAADEDNSSSIVGLWHVRFLSNNQLFDEGFDQWHSDGTEILNDTAPPQPANGAGTVCLGVFEQTAQRTYKLRHPFWSFDANGNLAGSGVFLERVTVDKSGNSYHGSFSFITYDLSGSITSEVTGEIKAQRITVD